MGNSQTPPMRIPYKSHEEIGSFMEHSREIHLTISRVLVM